MPVSVPRFAASESNLTIRDSLCSASRARRPGFMGSPKLARPSPSRPRKGKGGRSVGNGKATDKGVAALLLLGVTALCVSVWTSLYVPRLLVWRQGSGCVPGDLSPCLPENHHPDIDVVSVAVKPTCVTKIAIDSINQYIAPRRIHLITASEGACEVLKKMATNVRCHAQDGLVPGLTKAAVAKQLKTWYANADPGSGYLGRELSGWYLQQLLKLGAARHVLDLSHTFLVWDPDMIVLEPFSVFSKQRSGATGKDRVMRHVGGYVIAEYEYAYEKLTGEKLALAPDGSSYVTHQMVFERQIAEELLSVFSDAWEDRIREEAVGMAEKVSSLLENKDDNAAYGVDGRKHNVGVTNKVGVIGEKHNTRGVGIVGGEYMGGKQTTSREGRLRRDDETGFEKPQSTDGGVDTHHHMPTWASAVLASLNPQRLDLGFSEYASYASYVATHHPGTVEVKEHRAWTRHPLGPFLGSFGVRFLSRWSPVVGKCCPSAFSVRAMKLLGYQYGGFEVGHVASCGYDAPENKDTYGLPETTT